MRDATPSPHAGARPSGRSWIAPIALAGTAACAGAAPDRVSQPPDAARRLVAEHAAVTSANPLASDAGVAILRAGGNAVDAAVATAFAIGVVEPQMSRLGGGGGLLLWLQDERRVEYLDYCAAQPAGAMSRAVAPAGGGPSLTDVGVPGAVAGLLAAHDRFGTLPLADVLAPAIRLAEDGFPVNQVLAQMIAGDSAKLHRFAAAAAFAWPDGRSLAPGSVLTNPELGAALRAIAERGRDGFYRGPAGRAMVAARGRPPRDSRGVRVVRAAVAPTVVLEDGRVRLVSGAPGGGRIPTAIVQTLVYTLDYGMDPLAALRMPRMFPTPATTRVELENGFAADVLRAARATGWEPGALSFGYARLYSIVRQGDRWIAVADPRHDGEPRGW